ncbi:SprT family zinc-dependent metalloprotease [Thalassotalea sp. 1_MG-2023]|uniref:M48 family metallopeptidase n=1 Tax=Thalassotalea sp. 1_MG-2023 TaxID=3062680 RepID=UPI0026E12925|nr:SprT family zinc-dependent metalloprotease [Thalassotalea sp. 1_MG-2023]MDO6427469.1 SprT family zinc-dependent metalloprotease [Thalassotalea sp. 1_MG-2023]
MSNTTMMTSSAGLNFQLLRCHRRKRIALQVKNKDIIVKAPYAVPLQYIENLVVLKKQWIENIQSKQQLATRYQNQLARHGQVWFFGKLTPLIVNEGKRSLVTVGKHDIVVTLSARKTLSDTTESMRVKKLLEGWFKQQAEVFLTDKMACFSRQTNLLPNNLYIRQYKARWGCCDNRGHIKLNYLLMMLPESVIDYVIIHELCHLKFLNHSADFWNLVESFLPDYKMEKRWLKEHQHYLTWTTD